MKNSSRSTRCNPTSRHPFSNPAENNSRGNDMSIENLVAQTVLGPIAGLIDTARDVLSGAGHQESGTIVPAFTLVQKDVQPAHPFLTGIFSQQSSALASFFTNPAEEDGDDGEGIKPWQMALGVLGILSGVGTIFFTLRQTTQEKFRKEAIEAARALILMPQPKDKDKDKDLVNQIVDRVFANDLVEKLEHEVSALRNVAARVLGEVVPRLAPRDRLAIAHEVEKLLDHPLSRNAALHALGKIVPTLEDPKDRKQFADAVSTKMDEIMESYDETTPRTTKRAIRALAAIVPSLDPSLRPTYARNLVRMSYHLSWSAHTLSAPESLWTEPGKLYVEAVRALERVIPSLSASERVAFNRDFLRLTHGIEALQPEFQRATDNGARFQMEADAAKSLAKENVLPSIAGERGVDGFLNDIGLNRQDFDQAKGTGYEYGLIWYHLKSVEDSGMHTVLLDTLASADRLIKNHPDIFSTAKEQHAFRMGIVQSYVSSLSAGEGDSKDGPSMERFMTSFLQKEVRTSQERDALIEEARKIDKAFREKTEDRDREKVEGRK